MACDAYRCRQARNVIVTFIWLDSLLCPLPARSHRKKVGVDALPPLTEAQRDPLALIFCDGHKCPHQARAQVSGLVGWSGYIAGPSQVYERPARGLWQEAGRIVCAGIRGACRYHGWEQ